jgi:hypothetical protein
MPTPHDIDDFTPLRPQDRLRLDANLELLAHDPASTENWQSDDWQILGAATLAMVEAAADQARVLSACADPTVDTASLARSAQMLSAIETEMAAALGNAFSADAMRQRRS